MLPEQALREPQPHRTKTEKEVAAYFFWKIASEYRAQNGKAIQEGQNPHTLTGKAWFDACAPDSLPCKENNY